MADFIDEMQEELRKENLFLFFKNHRKTWIALILGSVLSVIAYGLWSSREERRLDADYETYEKVLGSLDRGDYETASRTLEPLLERRNGFGLLGWLQVARLSSRRFFMIPGRDSFEKLSHDYEQVVAKEDRQDLGIKSFLRAALWYQCLAASFPCSHEVLEFLEAPGVEGSPWGGLSLMGRALELYREKRFEEALEMIDGAEHAAKTNSDQGESFGQLFMLLKAGMSVDYDGH
jgi:hypothetical protein